MPGLKNPTPDENTYFVDTRSGAEMARLIRQDHLITKGMGGLLKERRNRFTGLHSILDLACGPGGWVMEVAFKHPEIEVVGVDISKEMISYARTQAKVQGLDNVTFYTMDILNPLELSDDYFDLVNARFLSGFMSPSSWQDVMREAMRVTRPGGTLRLTEGDDWGLTNSPAFEKMMYLSIQALQHSMQTFFPEGRHVGITPQLAGFLKEAGCTEVKKLPHVIDYSWGTDSYQGFYENWKVFFRLLEPFLIKNTSLTKEEFDRLYDQMLIEITDEKFHGIGYFLTVYGKKPRTLSRKKAKRTEC